MHVVWLSGACSCAGGQQVPAASGHTEMSAPHIDNTALARIRALMIVKHFISQIDVISKKTRWLIRKHKNTKKIFKL